MRQIRTADRKGFSTRLCAGAGTVLLTLFFGAPAFAQQAAPEMEEIIISSELTSSRLLFQVDRAQDEIYRLFNEMMDDKEFRITCTRRAPTGSYIIERQCQPIFLSNAQARQSAHTVSAWRSGEDQDHLRSMGDALSARSSDADLRFDLGAKYEQMNQKMLALASESPEFLSALQHFAELRAQYEAVLAEEQRARRRRR